jgi:hypothetical protein
MKERIQKLYLVYEKMCGVLKSGNVHIMYLLL